MLHELFTGNDDVDYAMSEVLDGMGDLFIQAGEIQSRMGLRVPSLPLVSAEESLKTLFFAATRKTFDEVYASFEVFLDEEQKSKVEAFRDFKFAI